MLNRPGDIHMVKAGQGIYSSGAGGRLYRDSQWYPGCELVSGTGIGASSSPGTGTLWVFPVIFGRRGGAITRLFQASSSGTSKKLVIYRAAGSDPLYPGRRAYLEERGHPTTQSTLELPYTPGETMFFGQTVQQAQDAYQVQPAHLEPRLGWIIPDANAYGVVGYSTPVVWADGPPEEFPAGATQIAWNTAGSFPVPFFQVRNNS